MPFVKKLGSVTLPDTISGTGLGLAWGGYNTPASLQGTGSEDVLLGSAVMLNDNFPWITGQIGYTGTMSGPVEYELTF